MKIEASDFNEHDHGILGFGYSSNDFEMITNFIDRQPIYADNLIEKLQSYLIPAINMMSNEQKAQLLQILISSLLNEKEQENMNTAINLCNGNSAKILKGMLNL